jgi:hypothetical protein
MTGEREHEEKWYRLCSPLGRGWGQKSRFLPFCLPTGPLSGQAPAENHLTSAAQQGESGVGWSGWVVLARRVTRGLGGSEMGLRKRSLDSDTDQRNSVTDEFGELWGGAGMGTVGSFGYDGEHKLRSQCWVGSNQIGMDLLRAFLLMCL